MYGGGQQVRDFVYLADVIDSLVKAADAPHINRGVINIGSGKGTSIAELVKVMEQVIGIKINTIANPERPTGVPTLIGDITLATQKLNYRPYFELADGLKRMIESDSRFNV